jgi:vancomycin permeability regulator SanA
VTAPTERSASERPPSTPTTGATGPAGPGGPANGGRARLRRGHQLLVLLSCLLLTPITWAYVASGGRVTSWQQPGAEVPSRPVALVLGAGVVGEHPSPFLARRLDIAAELYARGSVRAILVSGDNSRRTYDESTAMRSYLTGKGVPEIKVVADYAGFDTWDSCLRARKVFGVEQALVITQRFHVSRAVALCRSAGLDAHGVGDDSLAAFPGKTLVSSVREFVASGKAFWDAVVWRPDPHFLGPREPGIDRALAEPAPR